jgi:hypothetical protein
MSLQPPKIDNRSYDDIVAQTEALVEDFTSEVQPKVEVLLGQTLAEEVKDRDQPIAPSGKVIDKDLADKISKIQGLDRVKVKGWQALVACEIDPKDKSKTLAGLILNQDVKDGEAKIATRGAVIDTALAEKLSKIDELSRVKVKMQPPGYIEVEPNDLAGRTLAHDVKDNDNTIANKRTVINATLAKKISQISSLKLVKVKVETDAGRALIRIFGRMAALVSDRLNQVPDKNFLAFLNLIGTQLSPPQPASVPLTFSLVQGSPVDALVPAHTQVAAPPAKGQEEEVVFETDRELVVTTAQLQAVLVREPEKDKYSDRTLQATGKKDDAFEAFAGQQPIEHCLYLACDELFTLPGTKTVTLTINSPQASELAKFQLTWSYWDGLAWKQLQQAYPPSPPTNSEWQVQLDLPVPSKCKINGLEAGWLRARLDTSLSQNSSQLFYINSISAKAKIEPSGLAPDLCFFNTVPLDLSKDFYPFGEQTHFNDTLYIASQEVFARPGASVTVKVQLSSPLPLPINPSPDLEIEWEVWNGQGWQSLKDSSFSDKTQAFSKSEDIQFTLPTPITSTTVNGEKNYWLRARIIQGNYGTQVSQLTVITTLSEDSQTDNNKTVLTVNSVRGFMPNDRIQIVSGGRNPENKSIQSIDFEKKTLTLEGKITPPLPKGTSVILFSDSAFGPPSVKSLSLSYTYEASSPLSACRAYNDFHYVDLLATALTKEAESFQPFKATADRYPALYLGFDKPFANRPTTLFAQVEPPQPEEVASELETSDTKPVQLVWEYASPSGWSRLGVEDETKTFAERGLIQFIGPTDLRKTSEFGQELYWLRVSWQQGQFRVSPRLRRLLTNTMWATQATTLKDEILGSSDGNRNQIFHTVQKPVLNGQQLEVQEAKIPSPEEQVVIKSLEGDDAVNIVRDEAGQIEAVWVRWHKVRDFYGSGVRDRHYVLDRLTGEVQFGDGQYGMVPPQGRNNIRLSQYQTGGGTQGNLAANTVVQLKTTVPYVEKVTNLEAAGGGAEQESLEQVKERGPKFLRHRGRAVTWQDFEDLAYEASPDVARAKAIAPSFDPFNHDLWIDPKTKTPNLNNHNTAKPHNAGEIRMLIVPISTARQPVPSLALNDRVKAYIRERCDPSVNLQVTGPEWQAVSVTAVVVPVSLERANAVRAAVVQHLENFLHPLTGGKKGQGWALGRLPQPSDLYAVIESIPGVDHVQCLNVEPELKELSPEKLVYSGTHTITSILPKEEA